MTHRWILVSLLVLAAGCAGRRQGAMGAGPDASRNANTTLEVRAIDALTGAPITRLSPVGYDEGGTLIEVMPSGPSEAADGVHSFPGESTRGRIRFAADGYCETWARASGRLVGGTRTLTLRMQPLNHLVVHVLEADGSPVEEGTLHLRGPGHLGAIPIENGLAETWVEPDRIRIAIDPRFMEGYRPKARTVTLPRGERTEVTMRVEPR